MKVAVFDTHGFERKTIEDANRGRHELLFFEKRLTDQTAVLAKGCKAACLFVNDRADKVTIGLLKECGIRLLALRSAGFNHVDLKAARDCEMTVVHVPQYSPEAVAEHAVALLLTLNRKIHKAHGRVQTMNFSLDGLSGFNLRGKTVGTIGTGRIGKIFSQIMRGFGCKVIATDINPDQTWAEENQIVYTEIEGLLRESQVISLHVPLNDSTHHLINENTIKLLRSDAILINTARGALIDTPLLVAALKDKRLGGACLDVYENEAGIFFSDQSTTGIVDDILARLLTIPNVIITSHQAFLTFEALRNIAETTIQSLGKFEEGHTLTDVLVSN